MSERELRIVNADATPEEIAAVVAVIASLGGATTPPKQPRSTWAAHSRKVRPTLRRGPGAWRASGLPR
ncbi:MAG: acyl-CoA carboxylase subunit epsilon [Propionibacteriales bacterium]|nr:acyl-CoA carboxylase subunit epsilon [Propionibacteriales bacterium]